MIFVMFILLFFKNNKQEVVYLKPKGAAKKKIKQENKKDKTDDKKPSKDDETELTMADLPPTSDAQKNPYATMAFEDENVIRAELKALRQSAVSMSVNQREGATQIVKDWLSDGASSSEQEEG